MTTMTDLWSQVEPVARHKAYRTIDNDPMLLLEGDGGPGGGAEVYMARLFGLDDEIVQDGVRLREPMPVVRVPIIRGGLARADENDLFPSMALPVAEYVQQQGFAVVTLAAEYAPPDVEMRPDFTFRVMYLRYRRRL